MFKTTVRNSANKTVRNTVRSSVRHTVLGLTTFLFASAVLLASHAAAQTTSNDSTISRQPVPSTPSSTSPAPSRATPRTTAAAAPWTAQDYKLGAGDKLRVEVYKQEQLSQSLQVRPDGKITLPLLGDIMAAGRTPLELRDVLATQFKEYVNNPVVTVIVQDAIAAQITVIGEVRSQGPQVLNGSVNVLQALARAGGPGEFAKKNDIRILRPNGRGTDTIAVDYKGMLKGTVEPIYLQPGDTIVVP